ncbi:CHASE3 domain-containing protein [Puia sp. P3]|uniref:CHASE3 domain-containing protein n=1 Tax=Puia sp. P3 TaxID=3423952 RepID=UPI003D675528
MRGFKVRRFRRICEKPYIPGMKLATQIFLGFLIAISIDLLDSVANYMLTLRVKTVSEFLNRSELVIRQSDDVNKGMIEMESSFRGFLLTGDRELLKPFNEGRSAIPRRVEGVRAMVSLPYQRGCWIRSFWCTGAGRPMRTAL